jgi:hypothetical protein
VNKIVPQIKRFNTILHCCSAKNMFSFSVLDVNRPSVTAHRVSATDCIITCNSRGAMVSCLDLTFTASGPAMDACL